MQLAFFDLLVVLEAVCTGGLVSLALVVKLGLCCGMSSAGTQTVQLVSSPGCHASPLSRPSSVRTFPWWLCVQGDVVSKTASSSLGRMATQYLEALQGASMLTAYRDAEVVAVVELMNGMGKVRL